MKIDCELPKAKPGSGSRNPSSALTASSVVKLLPARRTKSFIYLATVDALAHNSSKAPFDACFAKYQARVTTIDGATAVLKICMKSR